MANELVYTASVDDAGQLKIVGRKGFDEDMKAFAGQRLIIRIKKYRKSRSNKQNAYYWGCVISYVTDGLVNMGFDRHLLSAENVHHLLRDKFLKEDLGVPDGEHAGGVCNDGEVYHRFKHHRVYGLHCRYPEMVGRISWNNSTRSGRTI